jgi:hypothetical protein
MISDLGEVRVIEVGTGDVLIFSGALRDDSGKILGGISFSDAIRPMGIGNSLPEWDEDGCLTDDQYALCRVKIIFSNPDSVDVLIERLQNAKAFMTGEKPFKDCTETQADND